MYSLDVNFLKDRHLKTTTKVATKSQTATLSLEKQLPIIAGLAAAVLLPALTASLLLVLNLQTANSQKRIGELDAEIQQLTAQSQSAQEIEKQIAAINEETKALVTVFNQIKPWSAILQEIRQQIPPKVTVDIIKQSEAAPAADKKSGELAQIGLTIAGYGATYADVNDFLLTLQASKFLKADKTRIDSAQLADFPLKLKDADKLETAGITVTFPQVVKFTMTTELSDIPASELLRELASNGAVGLVTRIRTLEQEGAIKP